MLVGREGPLHGGDQQPVELGALHVLAHAVVGVAQVPVAELGEALDADRSQLLVTPRKRGSRRSRANKQRIQRLTAAGRLAPAGLAAVTDAKADGSWTALDAVEELVEPEDLRAALDAEPNARANWDGFPGSTKRAILEWTSLPNAHRRVPAGSLRPPGWLPRASAPISGANQVAPSLNFPIRLQGNGDGATQHQRTVSMAAQRQTGFSDARECTPARRAGQASLALFVVGRRERPIDGSESVRRTPWSGTGAPATR